ncbi:adenylate/guanylate cyclase domain-containing protein [Planococcus maritimus]|uniref:adenylate/guanylate cyclase domain-containing protein n=1 Tax=Planococcus maritimus TaxID=192421 RepID=UPI0007921185|nr:adenylate/guanylate cyclase domain-containing protein [Planococcus maritimus]KYG57886.1 guanylate cyclase [Planococcus maritimus]OED31641.1 guanylate cyclase [Planococcus maritimus]
MTLKSKHYTIEKEYPVDRQTAWEQLADNNRLNDAIGLFPVKFQPNKTEATGLIYREAAAKVMRVVPMTWKSLPFEWQELEYYTTERQYLDGPLNYYILTLEFFEVSEGEKPRTKVRLTAEFSPKNVLGYVGIQATGVPALKKIMAFLDDYQPQQIEQAPRTNQRAPKVNTEQLESLSKQLTKYPVAPEFAARLKHYLNNSTEQDAAEIVPKNLAKLWNMPMDEVLRGMLYATKTGLLELSWHVICPNCRVSKDNHRSLSELEQSFHCDLCGVAYDANFDQSVELHFSVHPTVRTAYAEVYCVGSPLITPHVIAQRIVRAGQAVSFKPVAGHTPMRLRVLQLNDQIRIGQTGAFCYTASGWVESSQETADIAIVNDSEKDIVVALEYADWSKETVTAAKVTAMQEFRDLFSSEVLAPGQKIAIGHVTILFTDLKGSTALYEESGDANAYGRVRRHFDFLTEHIKQNSGSVVKTIGDAVMAVFSKPADGVRAALAIQEKLDAFNAQTHDTLLLRVGLFSGPAIAVNSNDRLDYFGRTVNLAARVQGQGDAGEVIISRALFEQPDVAKLLEGQGLSIESFTAELKGIEGEQALVRLRMHEMAHIEAG